MESIFKFDDFMAIMAKIEKLTEQVEKNKSLFIELDGIYKKNTDLYIQKLELEKKLKKTEEAVKEYCGNCKNDTFHTLEFKGKRVVDKPADIELNFEITETYKCLGCQATFTKKYKSNEEESRKSKFEIFSDSENWHLKPNEQICDIGGEVEIIYRDTIDLYNKKKYSACIPIMIDLILELKNLYPFSEKVKDYATEKYIDLKEQENKEISSQEILEIISESGFISKKNVDMLNNILSITTKTFKNLPENTNEQVQVKLAINIVENIIINVAVIPGLFEKLLINKKNRAR